jgi:hypothetical protein
MVLRHVRLLSFFSVAEIPLNRKVTGVTGEDEEIAVRRSELRFS